MKRYRLLRRWSKDHEDARAVNRKISAGQISCLKGNTGTRKKNVNVEKHKSGSGERGQF